MSTAPWIMIAWTVPERVRLDAEIVTVARPVAVTWVRHATDRQRKRAACHAATIPGAVVVEVPQADPDPIATAKAAVAA